MHLYNLTIEKSRQILHTVCGNFIPGSKEQVIIASSGKNISLLKVDSSNGKIITLFTQEFFSVVRSLASIRLTGSSQDYLVVGCESGRLVILSASLTAFIVIHSETFGKSGCRRIVCGEYVSVDPRGRAVMVSAIEKQKLVYILNHVNKRLTISSPLEGHKSNTLLYATVGVDVGFDNPIFACLEMEYDDEEDEENAEASDSESSNPMVLSFYELDLGLNHVVRKYSEALDSHANDIISVPGGNDGPSGVLVCQDNGIIVYKNLGDQPDISHAIPVRSDTSNSVLITCHTQHKSSRGFFFLVQTQLGDVFKVTLEVLDGETVSAMELSYLDTLPVGNSMLILKSGFLLLCSMSGDHVLYQMSSLEGDVVTEVVEPHEELKNFVKVDTLDSLSPLMDLINISDAKSMSPALLAITGSTVDSSSSSSLRIIKHGLPVTELAVSQLPASPLSVWSIKKSFSDPLDSYIVVSFAQATLVLSVSGSVVEEVTDSGFLGSTLTLASCQIGSQDHVLQVYPSGIRNIKTSSKRVNEWRACSANDRTKKSIVSTAVNNRQVVVALTGGEIVYFEMTDQLNEYTDRKDMNHEVVAMALQRVSENETRTRFLAIALTDKTVRIVSLDPKDCLTPLSMQAFNAPAYSLSFVKSLNQVVSLNVGLENGLFLRTVLDNESGDLSDTNIRYLGNSNAPVRVVNYQEDCLIALNEGNNWFVDKEGHLTPLDYQVRLLNASGFNSSLSEGIVAVDSTQLLILQLDMTTGMNHVRKEKLDFTPRKLVDVKLRGYCVIENSRSPNEGGKGSVIRLLNKELKTANKVLLQSNEDAVSLMTMVDAHGRSLVLVGVALNLILNPRSSTGGCIHVYEVTADLELQLLHVTLTDEVPYAICDYSTNSNLIIASILNNLWVYEIGKKMLLKKNQIKGPSRSIINNMTRKGRRIFVSTVSEGVFFVDTQDWSIIAEDCRSRYTTAMTVLDYSTLVVGDKFGNVSVVRLEEEDETIKDKKLKILCTFYVGETLTVLKMTTLSLQECIVYATLSGSIGVLIPFKSKDDQDLLNHLEMHLRQQPTLSGRDHRDFRSYYEPVKNVIDGDLCETYIKLDFKKQKDIAEQMDRTVNDITNKLDTLRAQHAF